MAGSRQSEAETVAREARDLGVNAVRILADAGKKAEAELTGRRLAGPAVRDAVTGRLPTEIDPEMGEQRASAEFPWPALCDRV
jgi:hypothetical protein